MFQFLFSSSLRRTLLFCLVLFLFFLAAPSSVRAVVFESGIPGVGSGGAQGADIPTSLPVYISYLYVFLLGAVGIAGFVSLVVWGTVWVASGIVDKKAMALESIKNTFIGIGIALSAFIILNTINPALTTLSSPPLQETTSPASPSFTIGSPCTYSPDNCSAGLNCFNGSCIPTDLFCNSIVNSSATTQGMVAVCNSGEYPCSWCSSSQTCISKNNACP